ITQSDLQKNVNKDHQSDAQRIIDVNVGGRTVKAPIWTQPGHPDGAITLFLGYGQQRTGRVGTDTGSDAATVDSQRRDTAKPRGYDAYSVRPAAMAYAGVGTIRDTGKLWPIAVTQGHFTMDNREPVKVASLEEYLHNPRFANENPEEVPKSNESLYPAFRE